MRILAVAAIAPVLMRARIGDDLLQRENWTFASEVYFRDAVDQEKLDDFGVPFYQVPRGGVIYTRVPGPNLPGLQNLCAHWLAGNERGAHHG